MEDKNRLPITADEAREKLRKYQEETGKSQNDIAKEMGYNNATALSRFRAGTYDAEHEVIKKVVQFFKITEKRRAAPKKPTYKATSTSLRVASLIELCHTRGELGVAYGDPGVGKTEAVRQYAKENKDAIVITISPTNATITGVNELIAEALGIKEKVSRRITAAISQKLKGTKRVIVIDEAQHLKAKVVNHLRSIVDATEDEETGERIGMALIGNDEIFIELKIKQAVAYSQVADRITYWEHLIAKEAKKEDINLIFTDANLAEDALNLLYEIGTGISVRKAVQVFTNTISLFNIQDYSEMKLGQLATIAKEMKLKMA